MGAIANVVKALIESGATQEMILCAVEAMEQTQEDKIESRKKADRERQQRKREKDKESDLSRDITLHRVTDVTSPSSSSSPLVPPLLSPAPLSSPPLIPPSSSPSSLFAGEGENFDENFAEEFESFWENYPENGRNKGSRKDALSKFKIAKKKDSFEKIMEGVKNYAAYIANTGQKNADAFRWLEKERWRENYIFATVVKPTQRQPTADENFTLGIQQFLSRHGH